MSEDTIKMAEDDRQILLKAKTIIKNQTPNMYFNKGTNNMLFTWILATRGVIPGGLPNTLADFLKTENGVMMEIFYNNMLVAINQAIMEYYNDTSD